MFTVAFGESTMCRMQVPLWYKRFKKGREDVNARLGRRSTSTTDENIEKVESLLERLLMILAYRSAHAK